MEDRSILGDVKDDALAFSGVGLLQNLISPAILKAINSINNNTPQDSSIGEMMGDFANKEMGGTLSVAPLRERTARDLLGPAKDLPGAWMADYTLAPMSGSSMYSAWEQKIPEKAEELRGMAYDRLWEALKDERTEAAPLDKTHFLDGLKLDETHVRPDILADIQRLASEGSQDFPDLKPSDKFKELADQIFSTDKSRFLIDYPRNNLNLLAHEIGHAKDFTDLESVLDRIGGERYSRLSSAAEEVSNLLSGPTMNTLSTMPGFVDAMAAIKAKSPLAANAFHMMLTPSIPALGTGLLASSKTLRNAARTVLPFEPVNKTMDFIEEHPVGVALSGALPQLAFEGYTMIPGGKLTYDFFNHLNSLDPKNLASKDSALLGELAGKIGKFSPTWETMKYLGHNALANSTYALGPILLAAAAYLNSPSKETENV